MRSILVSCLVILGCGDAGVEHSSRFVGTWAVEETVAHAEYGAAIYELDADGGVVRTLVTPWYPYPRVSREGDPTLTCEPASTWHSVEHLLVLQGACSDGNARDIAIEFVTDTMQNIEAGTVELKTVDGDAGWREPMWGWSFTRCVEATCGGLQEPPIET
ncbi:MAG: hypothetical protein AB7P03_23520 [Kofleriaceae bacterium]